MIEPVAGPLLERLGYPLRFGRRVPATAWLDASVKLLGFRLGQRVAGVRKRLSRGA